MSCTTRGGAGDYEGKEMWTSSVGQDQHTVESEKEAVLKLDEHSNVLENTHAQSTPSSTFEGRKRPFNPFNRNLIGRLEVSTFSPTVFKNVISPGQVTEFKWTIEDVSRCMPAEIDESSVHLYDSDHVDIETEASAQDAIQRYFTKVEIPSPWQVDAGKACSSPLTETETPEVGGKIKRICTSPSASINTVERQNRTSTSVAVQTCWSFPPIMPDIVEELLKPYMQLPTNETEMDDQNLSTSTLRRKLDFTVQDCDKSERLMSSSSCDESIIYEGRQQEERIGVATAKCWPNERGLSQVATPVQQKLASPQDISPILRQPKVNSQFNLCQTPCGRFGGRGQTEVSQAANRMSICETPTRLGLDRYEDGCSLLDSYEQQQVNLKEDPPEEQEEFIGSASGVVSQDTGYQTQTILEDKPFGLTNDTNFDGVHSSDVMMDTSIVPWTESVLQACSTPTKCNTNFQ